MLFKEEPPRQKRSASFFYFRFTDRSKCSKCSKHWAGAKIKVRFTTQYTYCLNSTYISCPANRKMHFCILTTEGARGIIFICGYQGGTSLSNKPMRSKGQFFCSLDETESRRDLKDNFVKCYHTWGRTSNFLRGANLKSVCHLAESGKWLSKCFCKRKHDFSYFFCMK